MKTKIERKCTFKTKAGAIVELTISDFSESQIIEGITLIKIEHDLKLLDVQPWLLYPCGE